MKKSLVFIPMLALVIAGCTSTKSSGKKKKSSGAQVSNNSGNSAKSNTSKTAASLAPLDPLDPGASEFSGYRRVMHKPEAGKDYILGFWHVVKGQFLFMNGHHHTDANGEYPFYQSTTTDVSKAVKINIEFASDNEHYAIKIKGEGEFHTYDGKYLEIYEAQKSSGGTTASIRQVESAVQKWYYAEASENIKVETSVMDFESTQVGQGKGLLGCSTGSDDYTTVSANPPKFFGSCYICHLWEPIA